MPENNKMVVLIVEDEPLVRMAAIDIVEDAGYIALVASNADDALLCLQQHPEIRIVFTDIEMPGSMDGMRLAAAVRDRWPPVEIILTSGRVERGNISLPSRGVFLPKPYRPVELREQLDRMAA